MKHLGIFSTSTDIQNALNNNALINPYIALSGTGGSRVIDYNTLIQSPTSVFSNISVTSNIEYSIDADITWNSPVEIDNFNYVKVNGIPQSIKNYILNGNHNRWYVLENPIYIQSITVNPNNNQQKLEIVSHYNDYDYDYNEINTIKYDELTGTLYLSRGIGYDMQELVDWDSSPGHYEAAQTDRTSMSIEVFPDLNINDNYTIRKINCIKIFFDNNINDFKILGLRSYNIETNNLLVYNETSDACCYIPSILVDYIEDYHNNIWDGSEVILLNNIIIQSSTSGSASEEMNKISIVTYNNEEKLLLTNDEVSIYIDLITLSINIVGDVAS